MPRDAPDASSPADRKQNVVKYRERTTSRRRCLLSHRFRVTGRITGEGKGVPVNTNKNGKPAVMAGGKHDAYL